MKLKIRLGSLLHRRPQCTQDRSLTKHHFRLVIGVMAISFSPLAVKLVTFSTTASAFYRSFYAALFFGLWSLFAAKKEWRGTQIGWVLPSILAGVFLGIDLVIWHKTILLLGAGPATFLGNSQIIFMTLFAALVYKEKIPLRYYGTVAMVMVGLYLLTPAAHASVSRPLGYALGMLVGLTYAGMLVCLRSAKARSAPNYPELISLCLVFAVSALVIAAYSGLVTHETLLVWEGDNHLIMMVTAFLCQTFGWYLINRNITEIAAHEGSLLLMLQPLLATVWGCVFFSEAFNAAMLVGIVLTLTGILLYQLRRA